MKLTPAISCARSFFSGMEDLDAGLNTLDVMITNSRNGLAFLSKASSVCDEDI